MPAENAAGKEVQQADLGQLHFNLESVCAGGTGDPLPGALMGRGNSSVGSGDDFQSCLQFPIAPFKE